MAGKKSQIARQHDKDFSLNEIVFCKIRGCASLWPSRLIYINVNDVMVEFLGDMGRT